MADTSVSYTANGSTNTFAIPFPYLDRYDIVVRVNGIQVTTGLEFLTDSQVKITPTPTSGKKVTIVRTTPYQSPRVTFKNASVLLADDLNAAHRQLLYVIQETRDRVASVEGEIIGGGGNTPGGNTPNLPTPDEANVVPVFDGETWHYYNAPQFKAAMGIGTDYIRAAHRTAYNVSLGNYPTALAWIERKMTHVEYDQTDSVAISNTNGLLLPAGTYRVQATAYWNIETHIAIRLKDSSGAIVMPARAIHSDRSTSNAAVVEGVITLPVATGLKLETAAAGFDDAPGAQGIAHNTEAFGDNVYTVLELWKIA